MVGGGRLELDLNRSADPEMTHPIPYQKCMDKLTGVVTRLRVSVKEDLFPHYLSLLLLEYHYSFP